MRGIYFTLSILLVALLFASFATAFDWNLQDSGTTDNLHSVWFTSERVGYVVGANQVYSTGIILSTEDGGNTWVENQVTDQPLFSVCFSDANHGWAVGQDTVLHYSDGSWTTQSIPFTTITLEHVSCIDSETAYAVGSGGHIIFTSDGGDTWSSVSSGTTYDLYGSYFTDADHGYVVGDSGTILKRDGGIFRILDQSRLSSVNTIACSSFDDCWIAGFGSTAYHTTNGGDSWSASSTGDFVVVLNGIFIVDPDHIYMTGNSVLRQTDTAGDTWVNADTEITGATGLMTIAYTRDVFFVGDQGWVVGEEGTILHTGESTVCPIIENACEENSTAVYDDTTGCVSSYTCPVVCPVVENTCIADNEIYATVYNETTGCVAYYACALTGEQNYTLQASRTCVDDYRDCIEAHWPRIDECDAWEFCEGTDQALAQVRQEHVKDTFDSAGQYTYFQNFLNGEQVNVYLTQADGKTNSFGLSLTDGVFSVIDAYDKPTITVSLSQDTVDTITASDDEKKAALDAVNSGEISIQGIGFKAVKVFFLKAGLKISLPFVK